jgi:two-component SAPR family response regulator
MIETFEDITTPLTEDELRVLPYLVAGLERRTSSNPITSKDIVDALNRNLDKYGVSGKFKVTGARLRKMINYLRVKSVLCVIATSEGYFTTDDRDTIEKNVRSLEERAGAISAAAEGLKKFLVPGFRSPTLFD